MVTLHIDDELAEITAKEVEGKPIEQIAQELLIFGLYSRSMISGGKASKLLGMDRYDFIEKASSLGIPYFNITPEELEAVFKVLPPSER